MKQIIVCLSDTEYAEIKATPEKYKTLAHKILERGTPLDKVVEDIKAEIEETLPHETVTEFADRCRECGAKYGKLLKQEPCEDAISRQAVLEEFIPDIIESVKIEICDTYCKYPCIDGISEEALTEICENCPLSRLG